MGLIGRPPHPIALQASKTFFGVGVTGGAGACGAYKPEGTPVASGAKSCMLKAKRLKSGRGMTAQMTPDFLTSCSTAAR